MIVRKNIDIDEVDYEEFVKMKNARGYKVSAMFKVIINFFKENEK